MARTSGWGSHGPPERTLGVPRGHSAPQTASGHSLLLPAHARLTMPIRAARTNPNALLHPTQLEPVQRPAGAAPAGQPARGRAHLVGRQLLRRAERLVR